MYGLNIPNKISWHDDNDQFSYCYKGEIIYVDVCLRSSDSGPKGLQRGKKSKAPSNFFFKVENFWSIKRYINGLMNLIKTPVVITELY